MNRIIDVNSHVARIWDARIWAVRIWDLQNESKAFKPSVFKMMYVFDFNVIQMSRWVVVKNVTVIDQKMNLQHSSEAFFYSKNVNMLEFNVQRKPIHRIPTSPEIQCISPRQKLKFSFISE